MKDIDSLASKADDMAEQAMKECWNRYQTPSVRVPTKEESITFVRQSTFGVGIRMYPALTRKSMSKNLFLRQKVRFKLRPKNCQLIGIISLVNL